MRAVACLALLVIPSLARADIGVTARSAGMGGIGVATGRGAEGAFYNPALLLSAEVTELSVSASAYGFASHTMVGYLELETASGLESTDLASTLITSYPSAAASAIPFQAFGVDMAFGFGVFIPTAYSVESTSIFTPAAYPLSIEVRAEENVTEYWIDGVFALELGPLALGVGAIAQITQFGFLLSTADIGPGPIAGSPSLRSVHSSWDAKALDLRGVLGLALPLDPIVIGLTVLSPSANLFGTAKYRDSIVTTNARNGTTLSNVAVDDAGATNTKPLGVRLGVAYDVRRSFTAGLDLGFDLPYTFKAISFDAFETPEGEESDDRFDTEIPARVTIAAGGELWLSDDWAVRAGYATEIELGDALATDAELDALNQSIVDGTQADVFDAISRARGESEQFHSATLGLSFARGRSQVDLGLTGSLTVGTHVAQRNRLSEGGDLFPAMGRRDIRGYSIVFSVGGTYGFEDEDEKKCVDACKDEIRAKADREAAPPDAKATEVTP